MASPKKSTDSFQLGKKIKEIIFSSQGFPIFLSFTTLAILLVLFRMKNVEMDYTISKTNREIEKVVMDNKELKAKKSKNAIGRKAKKAGDSSQFKPTQTRSDNSHSIGIESLIYE